MYNIKDNESGKKGAERVVTVALLRLQCRVSGAHNQLINTTLQTAQPKMATAIFGFGLTRAPRQPQGFGRKNTIVGKCRGRAATMHNKQFGAMSGVTRWKALTNSKLDSSWQV